MKKIVGIQPVLNEMTEALKAEGYKVTNSFRDDNQPVSAYIYIADEGEEVEEAISMNVQSQGNGILMINAINKTYNEILETLRQHFNGH